MAGATYNSHIHVDLYNCTVTAQPMEGSLGSDDTSKAAWLGF